MKYNAVKTNSMSELIEAIDLFKELGYKRPDWLKDRKELAECVFIDKDYEIITGRIIGKKEITLPELRDLVVLKRNDRKDSNISEENCLYDLYLTESEDLYFYHCGKNEWILSNLNGDEDYCKSLKPIEKKMKEYLEPHPNGRYVFIKAEKTLHPSWIEIPKGADIAVKYKNGAIEFFKENYSMFWLVKFSKWVETMNAPKFYKTGDIFWQRHTQPEELPLIDGEPKPDTPMAYMEREFERDQCMENARLEGLLGDPRIGAPHNPCDEPRIDTYKSEFEIEPPISLNSQYAEIEKFRLKEKMDKFNNTDRGADFDNFELLEDSVNHPSHYSSGEIECIDAIQSSMTHEAFCGYLKGNVQKYMWRYESKGGVESLKKAQWYLNKLIEVRNENSSED